MTKKILILLVALVFLSNIPVVKFALGIRSISDNYHFVNSNEEFSFTLVPSKGRDTAMMERRYKHWVENNSNKAIKDDRLYRTFEVNVLKFWNWYEYLTSPIYHYPYIKV